MMNGIARKYGVAAIAVSSVLLSPEPALGQGIEVAPTNILLAPGRTAASLTVTNHDDHRISFQIRGFSWRQHGGEGDSLEPTDALVSSPPIATIQPGASQTVRLVLREAPQSTEQTYRILFDQLPPPSEAGVVHILIRLSIPVFAEPQARVAPVNDGSRHLSVHDLKIRDSGGHVFPVEIKSPPHILAGASRRWHILAKGPLAPNQPLRLTASADVGAIDERISPDAGP
jgi:fimbrial chaperone protein